MIIIPFLNGYFIGNIPYFQTTPFEGPEIPIDLFRPHFELRHLCMSRRYGLSGDSNAESRAASRPSQWASVWEHHEGFDLNWGNRVYHGFLMGFSWLYLRLSGRIRCFIIVLTIHAPKSKRVCPKKWDPEEDSPIEFGDFWGSVSRFLASVYN